MAIATITSNGQVTIPKQIRDQLELQAGDQVHFMLNADGIVEFFPVKQPISTLKGIVPKPAKPVSLEAMDKTIQQRRSSS